MSSPPPVPSPAVPGAGAPSAGAGFSYPRPEIEAAARATTSVSEQARAIDPGAPLRRLDEVLPGSRAAAAGDDLVGSWQRGVQGLCDDLAGHARALLGSSAATAATDTTGAGELGRTLFGGALDSTGGH